MRRRRIGRRRGGRTSWEEGARNPLTIPFPHVRRKSEGAAAADVSTMEIDEEGETKEQRRARKEAKKAVSVVRSLSCSYGWLTRRRPQAKALDKSSSDAPANGEKSKKRRASEMGVEGDVSVNGADEEKKKKKKKRESLA